MLREGRTRGSATETHDLSKESNVVQRYLAHTPPPPLQDPTVALCLGTYGDPMGVVVSYERGSPEGCEKENTFIETNTKAERCLLP